MYTTDPRRRLLLHELELQCSFALAAYTEAAAAIESRNPDAFWGAMHALLAAAAQIQRFPELDVPHDSPLRQPELASVGDTREAFERWIEQHPRGPLRLSNFGPFGVSVADPSVFARYIDVERSVAILFGHAFHLPSLLAAVAELRERVRAELHHLQEVV